MEHSNRFTKAVTKLYNAFHKGELNAMNPCCCAVGNMCNNSNFWTKEKTGYSIEELYRIEDIFMFGKRGDSDPEKTFQPKYNENVFKSLCEVIEYLCELECIPNVMDYSKLFETENSEPKYKLESVLC